MASVIPAGINGVVGLFRQGSSWKDRVREAAFTSPSGTRIKFDFEDTSRQTTKRGAVFEFPGVDGGYVQTNGKGPRRYPLRCFFSGPQHDLVATAFEAALLEEGIGKLEHPVYGPIDVVSFGDITRREDLVAEANQTIVEVTFFTTLRTVYPSSSGSPGDEITAALAGFDVTAAQNFSDSTSLVTTLQKANLKSTIRKFLRDINAALTDVSDATEAQNQEFRDITSLINEGLDTFIGAPLELAQQISNLIKAPAIAAAAIEDRLAGYEDLANRIFGSPAGKPGFALTSGLALALRTDRIANDFHASDLVVKNAVTGSVLSVTNHTFATKPEAINAADAVQAQFDAAVAWRDDGFSALTQIPKRGAYQVDTGESYQALQNAVALTTGFLVQISFQLVPERAIVLGRPRTIIDLAAELYGSVDDRLDLLINSNDLSGDEILELQPGRRIVYYPAA